MKGTHVSMKAQRRQQRRVWCNEPGCHEPAESWETYNQWVGKSETLYLCHTHMLNSGFCMSCGYFCAGSEDFDFSPMPGYCYECRDEIKAELGEDDDWDNEYGFMSPYFDDEKYANDASDWVEDGEVE